MGNFILKALDSLSVKKERTILMLGLDGAGKTPILYQMKIGQPVSNICYGFNVETIEYKNLKFTIWDIPGQWRPRQLWHHYFQGKQALIYALDSSDSERMNEVKQSLEMVLNSQEMKNIPVQILANKKDKAVMTLTEISDNLQLHQTKGVREWHIQGCCALNEEGLNEGLDWLSKVLNKQK